MKNIVNTTILTLLILFIGACASITIDDKITQLTEHKKELSELKQQIAKLESEIEKEQGTKNIAVNVATKTLKPQTYNHFIEVTGKVRADENTIISPERAGKIINILADEGDKVKKGQVLAYLNTDAIQSQIEQAKVNLRLAATTFIRQQKLWNQNIGSEIEYLQAKSNKESLQQSLNALEAQLAMSAVKSQIDGIVDEVFQKKGEIAGPGMPFARVVNIDKIYISTDVGERFIGKIKKGDETSIFFPALNKNIEAKIFRSSTVIHDISRTFRVRINLNNPDHVIKPNLISVVKLKVFSADDLLIVPSILVKQDFEGEFIFITQKKDEKFYAKKQYVTSIFNSNNNTIISEGLKDGDMIITEGYDQIVNGTEIAIVKSSAL